MGRLEHLSAKTREPEDLPRHRETIVRAGDPLGVTMTAVNDSTGLRAGAKRTAFDFTRASQAMLLIGAVAVSVLCWLGLSALILL